MGERRGRNLQTSTDDVLNTMSQPNAHHVYPPGQVIPGTVYMVRKKLGEGGMGVVYEVEDTSIGKIYVVKTVHLRHAGKASYSDLTLGEARMLAKLRHRNIVQVITAGTTDDTNRLAYFVMEKLEGCTVGTLRGVALPFGYVWQIGRELLDALQYVHHPKDDRPIIVHRDVKPENIFLAKIEEDEGGDSAIRHRVKLLDFGIGAVVGIRPEGFWGTARYGSPEQLQLEPVTPKTDLYAAGVVLFELLTGRHPFEGAKTAQDFMDAHRLQTPPRVSEFVHVPKAVDDCIDAALSKVPDRRPRDAHKMMTALAELRSAERPSSQRHANTTIQDLNTVIERQTETGYEAYASSGADTIEGMSRPPVDLGGALEDAYPSGPSKLAVGPTEPAIPGAMHPGKGATVPMRAPKRNAFREAPTRSFREPKPVRRAGSDTEELLDGLDGFDSFATPSNPRGGRQSELPSSRGAPVVGGTSAPVGNSIVLPIAGPSTRTVAKSVAAAILGAGAIAAITIVRCSSPQAAADVALAPPALPPTTGVAAPISASPVSASSASASPTALPAAAAPAVSEEPRTPPASAVPSVASTSVVAPSPVLGARLTPATAPSATGPRASRAASAGDSAKPAALSTASVQPPPTTTASARGDFIQTL